MDYSRFYKKFDEFKKKGKTEIDNHKICLCDPDFKKCDSSKLSKIKWDKLGIKEGINLKKSLENNGIYSHKESGINLCLTEDFNTCSPELIEKFTDFSKNKIRNTTIVLIFLVIIIIFIIFK